MRTLVCLPLLVFLVGCSHRSPPTDMAPATSTTRTPTAEPPLTPLTARVVVISGGDLCLLDGDSGALRGRRAATASDLLTDVSRPDSLVTLEPDDAGAHLVRYRLRGEQIDPTSSLPLSATTGRLFWAGETVVGQLRDEGTMLFWTSDEAHAGTVWSPIVSAAVMTTEGRLRLQTVDVPDPDQRVVLSEATLDAHGLVSSSDSSLDAPHGAPLLFAAGDGFGRIERTGSGWRIVGGPHDGFYMDNPDMFPVAAQLLGPGRLAVLTGPAPQLWVLSPWGTHAVALGDEVLVEPDRVEHRLAYDATRQRVWAVAGRTAYAVELPSLRIAATGGCPASAVAVITPAME